MSQDAYTIADFIADINQIVPPDGGDPAPQAARRLANT